MPVLLIAFLISAMSVLVSAKFKDIKNTFRAEKSSPSDLEDCADTSDAEDHETKDNNETEDNNDDSKEIGLESQLELQQELVILPEHQMNIFSYHHSDIITPPPDSNEIFFSCLSTSAI